MPGSLTQNGSTRGFEARLTRCSPTVHDCSVMWPNSQHDTRIMLLYFVVSRRSQPARPHYSIASSHNCILLVLLPEHRSCLNPPISTDSASLASVSSPWLCSDHRFYPILGPFITKQSDLFFSFCNSATFFSPFLSFSLLF